MMTDGEDSLPCWFARLCNTVCVPCVFVNQTFGIHFALYFHCVY